MAQQAGAGGRVQVICPGHSRPVPNLSFSPIIPDYGSFLISACLGGWVVLSGSLSNGCQSVGVWVCEHTLFQSRLGRASNVVLIVCLLSGIC